MTRAFRPGEDFFGGLIPGALPAGWFKFAPLELPRRPVQHSAGKRGILVEAGCRQLTYLNPTSKIYFPKATQNKKAAEESFRGL